MKLFIVQRTKTSSFAWRCNPLCCIRQNVLQWFLAPVLLDLIVFPCLLKPTLIYFPLSAHDPTSQGASWQKTFLFFIVSSEEAVGTCGIEPCLINVWWVWHLYSVLVAFDCIFVNPKTLLLNELSCEQINMNICEFRHTYTVIKLTHSSTGFYKPHDN